MAQDWSFHALVYFCSAVDDLLGAVLYWHLDLELADMTQEDIIWKPEKIVELCKQAGFADGVAECMGLWSLHEFARIVAAAEREECAKVCEAQNEAGPDNENWWECADAIRARGQA